MSRFAGKYAIVTGAAQGIGAATARRLAAEGATVACVDLTADRCSAIVDEITVTGGQAAAFGADVSDSAQVERLVADVVDRFGRIDVLVNNAGIIRDNLLFKMSEEDWDRVLDVNLKSVFLMTKAVQKHMVEQRSGAIVSLSSRSALGNRGQANYSAAKAGIQAFTATVAIELGPFGIRVNAVAPGYVATAMTAATAARVGSTPEEHQAAAAKLIPLRRVADPSEIASVVAFLASDDASYVTGQTIYVTGGAR
ncbi:3-oxoacyl-ACP reductase [Thermobispora bispora]|uniref:Short-chain dehydrogenase/reductase SDR n=1 Tax=Thermobispora bispora (strain ATCC 19993 / DSM 43833 / CBS 139.67 / JCM 10125 / KCTC 9307 / NBRC 14880 / R51) TaxID=469371 RepID=D6YAF4_THEBD|nr:glucose 1-dehydrogenase [Thermobispora bispora]ADG90207.1 short-chain dehydrogenase/reductase SDR [Thermobispora bispora DSM 43833]MBO2473264.1 3-oxoacyl-ACP reductase [Actinomycetales bacterium]MDI9580024.1 glucose 1-dehydrogenase [Thermobispora sp.]QSI46642.1 glucose 1-dehydrogenase [Thermobispora bispora]